MGIYVIYIYILKTKCAIYAAVVILL